MTTHLPPRNGSVRGFVETARLGSQGRSNTRPARQLLVIGPGVMMSMPLPEFGSLVIGRGENCAIRIDDPGASRVHATLHLSPEPQIEDHGSTNGTLVAGQPIEANRPLPLPNGAPVAIGGTLFLVQTKPTQLPPTRLWPHTAFEARLDEECRRSTIANTIFLVARFRHINLPPERLLNLLAPFLTWSDAVACYANDDYEVLLTGRNDDDLDRVIDEMSQELERAGYPAELAVVRFPADVRGSADDILSALSDRFRGPTPDMVEESEIVRADPAMVALYEISGRAAQSDLNILIMGETGSGKDVLARYIHQRSPRSTGPFVSFNCAAIADSLLDGELFGHERGAFTGAGEARAGYIEAASKGTLFLDEVGEMSTAMQAKLLRVIESREVVRVGATKPRAIDVRFLAATNRNLEAEIASGRFREDLYFRIAGLSVSIPPLRERKSEIRQLAIHFLVDACRRNGRAVPALSPEAISMLEAHSWPGNIRELRNVMERALVFCAGNEIQTRHLPVEKLTAGRRNDDVELPSSPSGAIDPQAEERDRILSALNATGGNQKRAAMLIGMPRRTFVRRLGTLGITRPRS